jgi:16S rRNA pseudouridine516 synthase
VARLYELVARHLGGSKTEARRLIETGAIAGTDGAPLNPRQEIPASGPPPVVLIDGEPLTLVEHVTVALHKPVGCVTAMRDDHHPIAHDLLEGAPLHAHLRPVGRLDLDTSGLLLWTTDGALVQRWTHPKRAVPRTYQAALARPHRSLPAGLTLDDGHQPEVVALGPLAAADAHPALARPADAAVYATITIVGGAYHEVRRIFAALDSHVLALCRVSFGRFALPIDLPAGEFREINPTEV